MLFKLLLILNLCNGYHSLPNIECNERLDVSINRIQRIYSNPSPIFFNKTHNIYIIGGCKNGVCSSSMCSEINFEVRKDNFKVVKLPGFRKYSLSINFGYREEDNTIYYINSIEYEKLN